MKHKAQESLEKLQYCDWVTEVLPNGMEIIEDGSDEEIEKLRDFIDCQLTVEEIEHITLTLSCNPIDDFDKNIFNKLQKQKEMWVSDDEC